MRRPLERLLVASAIAACTAVAACNNGGENTANQGDPNSLGSDTVAVPGNPATDSAVVNESPGMAGESTATPGSTSTGGMSDTSMRDTTRR
jgi:hypothetical protein